jgi:YidC/Oxa1 family membrane protein insertase
MQQSNKNLNLILFMVLSGLILAGQLAYQSWQQSKIQRPADSRPWLDLYVRAPASAVVPAVPGVGSALQLAADVEVADWLSKQRYRLPAIHDGAVAKKEPEPPPKPKPLIRQPPQFVELGNETSNLHVVFTSRGAAVVSVTLNQFQAADSNGLPENKLLELIPKDLNLANPSNLLLHYESPDDDRPVDTLGEMNWQVVGQKKDGGGELHDEVVFAADVPGLPLRITKTFTLGAKDYHVGLKVRIERLQGSTTPLKFRYQLTSGHGLPIEGEWYTYTYRNAMVGSVGKGKNFWRDFQDSRTIGIKEGGDRVLKGDSERIEYAGIVNQYFGAIVAVTPKIVFDDPTEPAQRQDFLAWARPTVEGDLNPRKPFLDDITMRLVTEALDVPAADALIQNYLLYYGPVKVMLLDSVASKGKSVPPEVVARYINQLRLDTLTDSPSPGFMGSFSSTIYWTNLLIYFTNIMHGVLGWLHAVVPNYGICIILLTLCVRALMHPISRKQARTSMKMQAIVPEIKKLQEKHKNDRQALAVAQMEMYRKHGVHPMGSCWIVFLQMPIFMGLYYSLQESIFFRLSPFLWIKNLAAPDMLIYWGENIPWISRPEDQGGFLYLGPYFNLLPIVAVVLMLFQQKFLMPPPTDEQQEMQQKMMKYMMIFMGLMFYKMAAGLCVYFIVSTAWGLTERKLLPKAKPVGSTTAPPTPSSGPNRNGTGRSKPRGLKEPAANGMMKKVQDIWNEILEQAKKK